MQFTSPTILLALAGLLYSVSAHGFIVSPSPRTPGEAYQAACGNTLYNNQKSDPAGPIELLMQSASSITDAAKCHLWLCKGYQFDDNTANVHTYSLGETIPMKVEIRAPHTGHANVSIVNTKKNTVIGTALKSWESYASTATGVTADETSFDITMPTELEGCETAGDCLIQWFWYAPPGVDQTYEGCIDFVVRGSGNTPKPPATSSTTVTKPTTSAVPTYTAEPNAGAAPATTEVPATTTTHPYAPLPPSPHQCTPPRLPSSPPPSTLLTTTREPTIAPAAGATKGPQSINKCLDAVNECIRASQSQHGGAVDFSACEAQRAACY